MAEPGARVQGRAFDAWNRGDLEGWLAVWDPEYLDHEEALRAGEAERARR